MKIIDAEETMLWLAKQGLSDSAGTFSTNSLSQLMDFATPPDSGRKTALSRALVSLFEHEHEALLWINEFGIWPSSEDWHLFNNFRRSFGEDSPLQEKPGHLFSAADIADISSLVALILYFAWGAILCSSTNGILARISHDEFVTLYLGDLGKASVVTDRMKSFL